MFLSQWLPESARYYVACGNQEKAHDILKAVAMANNKPMPLGKLKIEEVAVSRDNESPILIKFVRFSHSSVQSASGCLTIKFRVFSHHMLYL